MDTAETILIAVLTLAGLVSAGLCLLYVRREQSVLRYLCMTVAAFLTEYLVASGLLFMFDFFSILRTLILAALVNLLLFVLLFFLARKRGWEMTVFDWDLKKDLIPLLMLLAGILLSSGNFGFYGMGQDPGVYQTKAISLMYGENQAKVVLEEYDRLESEEQREQFLNAANGFLIGQDNINNNREFYGLKPLGEKDNASYTHGIPTFSAALALFGTLFGMGNMAHLDTVLYLLTVLLIWYTAQNLRLKKGTSAFISLIFLLSPQAVWLSKATMTEMFLAMIVAMHVCLLTNEDRKNLRWLSALMVGAYAFLHLTIFVMMPMYALLYLLLWLYSGDRQYLKALMISAVGYMLGIQLAFTANPYYTYGNAKVIFVGPINVGNVQAVLLGAGVLILLLGAVLLPFKKQKTLFPKLVASRGFEWFFRILVVGFLGYNLFRMFRHMGGDLQRVFIHDGFYTLFWMTGLLPLPVTLIFLIIKPRAVLKTELMMSVSLMFLYAIVFRVSMLQYEVYHCYYYGRYYGALLPYVCLMAGLVWNRFSARAVGAGILAGALAALPFDYAMVRQKDDSKSSYEMLERVAEAVRSEKSTAVIFSHVKASMLYYLPVRAMTDADCYFLQNNLSDQIAWLEDRYDRVLYLADESYKPQDLMATADILLQLTEKTCEDDTVSHRVPWVPFPLGFCEGADEYTLMGFSDNWYWNGDQLPVQGGEHVEGKIHLPSGTVQFGPYADLSAGHYLVRVAGKNLEGAVPIVTANSGKTAPEIQNLEQSEGEIRYTFDLTEQGDNVELLTVNNSEATAEIEGIHLEKRALTSEE